MTINTDAYYDPAIRFVDDNSRLPGIVSAETLVRAFEQHGVPGDGSAMLSRLQRNSLIESDQVGKLPLTRLGRDEYNHPARGGRPRFF